MITNLIEFLFLVASLVAPETTMICFQIQGKAIDGQTNHRTSFTAAGDVMFVLKWEKAFAPVNGSSRNNLKTEELFLTKDNTQKTNIFKRMSED